MEVAGFDIEEDVVLRTKELAERGADLAIRFFGELGYSPATVPRNPNFLLEISAVAQIREWERHGLAESLGDQLPSYREALLSLAVRLEQRVASGKPLSPNLSKLVMRVGLENLPWDPGQIGNFAIVTDELDESEMLEALAELIWNNRYLLDSLRRKDQLMKKRSEQGRLLFYTRDSGGRHEMTPGQYIEWAIGEARKHGLAFDGTAATIQRMIRDGGSHMGDVFLDYGVKGNQLSREGLDSLFQEISQDHAVSHVCIPRRDRLARPDQALDGVQLENTLRSAGVTLIYTGKILSPLKRGNRQDLGDALMALVDFDNSGRFRRELANKIILAQIQLAQLGFSTGGHPPYGFRRWLVSVDGTPVRKLSDGERVRQAGHHTAWLPEEDEIEIIRRVFKMLETMPASQVARTLTAEGIPSPNAGKYRTDNGVRHLVRGCWNATTITGIGRNRLLIAIASYGRRSMGDQLRHSAGAPRDLTDADFRFDNKPKVTRNADADIVTGTAKFEPVVDPNEFERLQGVLDRRAGTQRGKPRSRDPRNNPLGARIVDMNCTGPMYRVPRGESFRYVCALYQQSHGQRCGHNTVDGPTATRFTLGCLRQRLLLPHVLPKLEARLRALASNDHQGRGRQDQIRAKKKQLNGIEAELGTVERNLARATSDAQFKAISNVFNELTAKRKVLTADIASLERETNTRTTQEEQLAKALETVRRLTDLAAAAPKDLGVVREIFDLVNARLYLNFETIQPKKRKLQSAAGGVVTFGGATPPIELYSGPMGRQHVKDFSASGEGKSLGNASRGDRI